MYIVQLTRTTGNKVLVNLDMVIYAAPHVSGTRIWFNDDCETVKESFDEIRAAEPFWK